MNSLAFNLVRQLSGAQFLAAVFLAVATLATGEAYAAAPKAEPVRVVDADGSVLQGTRLARPGAKPYLLLHGLTNNTETMDLLANKLYDEGYDVWRFNFRGHGNGEMESKPVSPQKKGDLGFVKVLTEDMPAIVSQVASSTGQKVAIYGFSMGGMVAKLYLSGVVFAKELKAGTLTVDRSLAMARAEKVSCLLTAGSPVNFREAKFWSRVFSTFSQAVMTRFKGKIPMVSLGQQSAPEERHRIAEALRGILGKTVRTTASAFLPDYLLKAKNFSDQEIFDYVAHGTSSMNFDIGEDIGGFVANGYVAEDGFDFEKPLDIFVPHLALGGSDDGLAHAGDIRSDMQVRERMREVALSEGREAAGPSFFVMVKGAAHAELTAGERYMSLIAPVAVQFEKNPMAFLSAPGRPTILDPDAGKGAGGALGCWGRKLRALTSGSARAQ